MRRLLLPGLTVFVLAGCATHLEATPADRPTAVAASAAAGTPGISPILPAAAAASPTPSPQSSPSAAWAPSPGVTASPNAANPPVPCPSGVVLGSATGAAAPLFNHGSRSKQVIALTIDDGASDAAVLADLAILEREQVNATFFPIGANVERSPAVWREVAAAGFPIGNHTYDHRDLECLSYAAALADIRRDDAVVRGIIGRPLLAVLRPPGGDVDLLVRQAAHAAGEAAVVNWDVTDGDTARDGDQVPLLIADGERGTNGSILLVHANRPYTQQALPTLIAYYRSRGFGFVTLGQLLGLGGPVPYPAAADPTPPVSAP